ncbi:MAG: hypothetical protein C0605_07090 [Hyphomicrobiales bacterium]|nr:MAG: hypothetical protein C0605_07090 [Hyphomicrobiales bacterium]
MMLLTRIDKIQHHLSLYVSTTKCTGKFCCDFIGNGFCICNEVLIGYEYPGLPSRDEFCIEDMAKPEERAKSFRKLISLLKRGGYRNRVAARMYKKNLISEVR